MNIKEESPRKSHFFKLNDSSLGRHVNSASRKSLEIQASFYYKTKTGPCEAKNLFEN